MATPSSGSVPVRFLVALVGFVCSRPRFVLAVSLLLCLASCLAAAFRLEYHTSRNDLLSAHKDCLRRWQAHVAEFGDDEDIVVVVQGRDPEAMKRALDAIATRLQARPELFDRVFHKVDLRHLRDRALMLAPPQQLSTIRTEYLADMRPLLANSPASWLFLGLPSLLQEAKQRLERRVPGEPLSPSDQRFFAQLEQVLVSARGTLQSPDGYRNPWGQTTGEGENLLAEPHYFFSADRELAFLLVRPVREPGSFTAALASVRAAREIVADYRREAQASNADLAIGLTGLPVLETDEMVAAERDTTWASYLALAGVSLLFLFVYRNIYYPLLTVATLLVGTAWAFGWLTLTVGHLNILSTTFAVMLIGMGDYGVLWVMRYEHARRQGYGVREALLHTTTHVAIGNLTAASTLALAFFAGLFADFKAVGELGWIAGSGVLLCAFACFTVLPALLMLFDRRQVVAATSEKAAGDTWLPWLQRRPGLGLLGGSLLAVLGVLGAARVSYDHNLLHLQAQDLESVQWQMTLIRHTTGASWHALCRRDGAAETLALAERMRQVPEVSQVIEVAALTPPGQQEKVPLVAEIQQALKRLPARNKPLPHIPADAGQVRADVAHLCQASDSALQPGLFVQMRTLREEMQRHSDETLQRRLVAFDERLAVDLCHQLHRLKDVARPATIEAAELPANLRERYIGQSGANLVRVFAREDLWDYDALERFTVAVAAVDPEATGKPFTTVEGLRAMKNGLTRAGVYAFVVIVLVLWLDFRSVGRTLLAVLPLVLGVLLSVGVLGWCGLPLNPANMIAFPLILGVGVDNGVHVLHDWLIRRREGRSGVSQAIGRGVLVKALTTMIGFAALMISTERGLVGLGLILTLGVGCSMLSALVVLPAALAMLGGGRERARPAEPAQREIRRAA